MCTWTALEWCQSTDAQTKLLNFLHTHLANSYRYTGMFKSKHILRTVESVGRTVGRMERERERNRMSSKTKESDGVSEKARQKHRTRQRDRDRWRVGNYLSCANSINMLQLYDMYISVHGYIRLRYESRALTELLIRERAKSSVEK